MAPHYEQLLANSRYNEKLIYQQQAENDQKTGKNRKHTLQ